MLFSTRVICLWIFLSHEINFVKWKRKWKFTYWKLPTVTSVTIKRRVPNQTFVRANLTHLMKYIRNVFDIWHVHRKCFTFHWWNMSISFDVKMILNRYLCTGFSRHNLHPNLSMSQIFCKSVTVWNSSLD